MKRQTGARFALGAAAAASILAFGGAQAQTLTAIQSYAGPGITQVTGVNDNGWMTGAIVAPDGSAQSFVRDASGNYTLFSVNSAFATQGRGLNNANTVAGFTNDSSGAIQSRLEFTRAADGTITTLANPNTAADLVGIAQGINNNGALAGDFITGNRIDGFILDGASFTDLSLAGYNVRARSINDNGEVAGFVTGAAGEEGFLWSSGGGFTLFNAPGAPSGYTAFEGVNDSGMVSGVYTDGSGDTHAFVFNPNSSTWTTINVPGAVNSEAFGINNLGQVAVETDNAEGPNNFLYTPAGVPEPAAWALMLTGFFGLGAALRRRRSLAAA